MNRVGMTVVSNSASSSFESYIRASKILENYKDTFRFDRFAPNADDARLMEGIRFLVS